MRRLVAFYLVFVVIPNISFGVTDSRYKKYGYPFDGNSPYPYIVGPTQRNITPQEKLILDGNQYLGSNNGTTSDSKGSKQPEKEENDADIDKKCKDTYPYCYRFVNIYGVDPPFTLCDKDWFINENGKYGCKKSCNLCNSE